MTAWLVVPEGLRLFVRLQPGARKVGIEGVEQLADGSRVLKVKVTAPPEDGKANSALISLLAKTLALPKRDLDLISGHKNRNKTVLLQGPGEELRRKLEELCGTGT
ncbi:MAG TPA: DUF167 family protein [Kiloniellales bacterium]|jgi:uncharacterized protein (TIGR00251 family)|nr:DUF167 family protein [Kiloniellales bacterium]